MTTTTSIIFKCLLCGNNLVQAGIYGHCRHCGSKLKLSEMLAVQQMIDDLKEQAKEHK